LTDSSIFRYNSKNGESKVAREKQALTGLERLWAPWRISYVTNPRRRAGCFICAQKREKEKSDLVVYRGQKTLILLNRYPYNNGHLMIAPWRHTAKLEGLAEEELLALMKTTLLAKKVLQRVLKPDGFNIGINLGKAAGAGLLGHIHIHIVPRWVGDANFMVTLAQTKVLSQSLNQAGAVLRKEIEKIVR